MPGSGPRRKAESSPKGNHSQLLVPPVAGGTIAGMAPQTPLKVGDKAPLFTLPSTLGQPISLAEYLNKGPVVLAWYLFDFGRV